jgi:hypothetical protein
MSEPTTPKPEDTIRMTPEQEQAALDASLSEEGTEPADEAVGAHTDAQGDRHYTEN